MRRVFFFLADEQRGGAARLFSFDLFSLFSRPRAGLATVSSRFFRVGNQYAECEKQLQQQHIPPKRFDIFPPGWGRCPEDLDAFSFFFKLHTETRLEEIILTGIRLASPDHQCTIKSDYTTRATMRDPLQYICSVCVCVCVCTY